MRGCTDDGLKVGTPRKTGIFSDFFGFSAFPLLQSAAQYGKIEYSYKNGGIDTWYQQVIFAMA